MKWFNKITDKIGYAPTLMLCGALLPLAVFGAGELLSLVLANLDFFHLQQFAMTISTGLTWGVIWPIMIALSVIGLLIGGIIDIVKFTSKKIQAYKENKKISLKKIKGIEKSKSRHQSKSICSAKKNAKYRSHEYKSEYTNVSKKAANNTKTSINKKQMFYGTKKYTQKQHKNFSCNKYNRTMPKSLYLYPDIKRNGAKILKTIINKQSTDNHAIYNHHLSSNTTSRFS